jgi:hypothetical protein
VLGVGSRRRRLDVIRQLRTGRLLAPGRAGAQHVERHPTDDRGQPPTEVLDLAGVGPVEPDPSLLDGVIALGL